MQQLRKHGPVWAHRPRDTVVLVALLGGLALFGGPKCASMFWIERRETGGCWMAEERRRRSGFAIGLWFVAVADGPASRTAATRIGPGARARSCFGTMTPWHRRIPDLGLGMRRVGVGAGRCSVLPATWLAHPRESTAGR